MNTPQQETDESADCATGRIIVTDIEELVYSVDPWQLRMNQISPGQLRAQFSVVQLLGILLTREAWSHRVAASGVTPIGYVAFAAPCRGESFTWRGYQMGGERLAYSRRSLDIDIVTMGGEEHWVMLIPKTLLDDFLGQEIAADLLPEVPHIQCDPRLIGQLSCLVTDTIALLEANDACQADHHVLVALRNQLLVATTRILLNDTSAQLDQGQATQRFLACRRARHAIEANASYSSMEELAKEVGVSRRSLEVAFRESIGMSPQLFSRYVRLNALHRNLLNASPLELSVTQVEQSLGFCEFGRTAGYYRKLFNELPSETLHREPSIAGVRLSDTLQ